MKYSLDEQRDYFLTGATRTRRFRDRQLKALAKTIEEREEELLAALAQDLGKSPVEAYATEIGYVLRDIDHARANLAYWMHARRVHTPLAAKPSRACIQPEPLGVVLIMGPWNYPLQLQLSPLVAALAAGNCAVLKPSEFAPATSAAVQALCRQAFPPELVRVVEGDAAVATELTALPFDHIFFTGSTAIGRKVAEAAARNLVPVTLELGGKSPCIVCEDANPALAARRIVWGKHMNAGQTCVAPDYVLVHSDLCEPLLEHLAAAAREFTAEDYGRIINRRHYDRLQALMECGTLYSGGESDPEKLTIKPAIITDVDRDSDLMREEIFGPLLPVLGYSDLDAELDRIRCGPSPLAAYIFTSDRSRARRCEESIRAGSVCINDTISQLFPADLPFGGVGASGQGRYHGHAGFDTFSNLKSIMRRSTLVDFPQRYPPYRISLNTIRRIYRWVMR